MARLPDELINRLKQEISLVRLMQSQGHVLKKHGNDFILSCPWHEDKESSLIVTPSTNLWHCMGACQTGGSVIDWVMKTQGVSFRNACEILQSDSGLSVDTSKPVKHNTRQKLPNPSATASCVALPPASMQSLAANADNQKLLHQVIDYYHDALKQAPEALEYLEKRGLNHPELITTFKLGYANRTLGYRLPEKNRKAGNEIRTQLQEIGILRATGHEHFNGSLVVPVINEQNQITEVYGRKILGARLRKGTAQHLYLPGAHEGVWNIRALQVSKEIILCEALIDAMTFWVYGFRHVTASYGTSGFTASHLAAFKEHEITRVLIAYDRDEAGNQAAEKLSKQLQAEGIECFRILFPKGMDANAYAQQVTPAEKSLGLAIRNAQWMGQGQAPQIEAEEKEAAKEKSNPQSLAAKPIIGSVPTADKSSDTVSTEAIPEPTQASPQPSAPKTIDAKVTEQEISINVGDRRYRIRGLQKNMSYDQLKINILVSYGEHYHVDTLDLYSARHRNAYIKQSGIELGLKDSIIKTDLGKVLLKLEALQEKQINQALEPEEKTVQLTDKEQEEALELLKTPDLLNQILKDFDKAGVVGEHTNKLTGYLASVSRKLDKPLAIVIQSSSAAGKSSLMDAILNMMPEEERVQYSAMTGQSLYYMGETNLKHKILAISEEEGAHNASYALKLLQSEGKITIASTGKDATTGNLTTQEYHVEGPVMLFLTTTAIDVDEELKNRCIVLAVNEDREQTAAIHAQQRFDDTLEGLLAGEEKQAIIDLHCNAQRLLKSLKVVNPFANQLTFLDDKTRTRRDHKKYLTLIKSIALLHQYQREVKTIQHQGQAIQYIEASLQDIEQANHLANEVLGRTLDELSPQTRRLLLLIYDMVNNDCQQQQMEHQDYRFSRRNVRESVGWSDFQVKTHMKKLEQLEYVLVHRGGRGQSFVYELLYHGEGQQGDSFLMGLKEIDQLKPDPHKPSYDEKKEHSKTNKEPSSSPQSALKEHGCRITQNQTSKGLEDNNKQSHKISTPALNNNAASYHNNASNPIVLEH